MFLSCGDPEAVLRYYPGLYYEVRISKNFSFLFVVEKIAQCLHVSCEPIFAVYTLNSLQKFWF